MEIGEKLWVYIFGLAVTDRIGRALWRQERAG